MQTDRQANINSTELNKKERIWELVYPLEVLVEKEDCGCMDSGQGK
jgi:hypothetical protein